MCREYALQHGRLIVAELAEDDRGASGASFDLPQLGQVLEMVESGAFDVLVVRELDRLSRNLAKQLVVEEELKRHGVEVEYVLEEYADTPEGRLNKHIRATIAEYEREKIAERMLRGKRNKVKAGNVLTAGRPPYGYAEVDQDGKQTLTIDEKEARVVRMIYNWYAYGDGESGPMGTRTIARKLTELGIPTYAEARRAYRWRDNAPWNHSAVCKILKAETYCGTWKFGKKRRNGAGRWENNSSDHLLTIKVPAIVDDGVWRTAQKRRIKNRNPGRTKPKYEYPMARRATCGHCGIKAHGKATLSNSRVYLYYRCAGAVIKDEFVKDCDAPYFRADQVDAAVWQWVRSFLTNPKALERGLEEHQKEQEKTCASLKDRLAVVDDLLADNRAQLERLLDLYLSGEFPKEVLTDRRARLEKTILAHEEERTGLDSHLNAQILSTDQMETIQELTAQVNEALEVMGEDFDAKRRIVEALDVQVTLAVEDGKKVVYVRSILGEQVCDLRPVPAVI